MKKSKTKKLKIDKIIECTCPGSLAQLCSATIRKLAKENENSGEITLKSIHGSLLEISVGAQKVSRPVISHSNLIKVKTENCKNC